MTALVKYVPVPTYVSTIVTCALLPTTIVLRGCDQMPSPLADEQQVNESVDDRAGRDLDARAVLLVRGVERDHARCAPSRR